MCGVEEPDDDLMPDLIDLIGIDLEAIAALPGSVFAAALERIYRELDGAEEPFFVQHQSSSGGTE